MTPEEREELIRLEAAFEENGGRGVEMAERIDYLRRKQENPLWENDLIQFARLLSEIVATQSEFDVSSICESMDLEPSDVDELFDRAHAVWERAKREREL